MALLVFRDASSSQNSELLKPGLRMEVADRVNQAILGRQGMSVEAKIKEWVRARAWSENEARRTKKDIPNAHTMRLGLDGEGEGNGNRVNDQVMNGNEDNDAMIS